MWAFLRGDPSQVVRFCMPLLIGGLVGGFIVAHVGAGHGVITAIYAGTLGAIGATLKDWRTERGLWMLAVLFLLFFGSVEVCIILNELWDAFRGAQPHGYGLTVDVSIASLLLSVLIRFLFAVARYNFALSRAERDA
ncbi:MAG: hypothetical protein WD648_08555 [Planctomycetaceae bacterium]